MTCNETNTTSEEILNNMPWLVFKLKEQLFALNSNSVVSIFQINHEITPIPESPSYIKGIINMRGEIIPLMELRLVLGMISFEEEQQEFFKMLDVRKQDHMTWVTEFQRCLTTHQEFCLETDPHKCTFGKWFYNYKAPTQTIAFHLNKIEEPHALLHELGVKAANCDRKCKECKRPICLQKQLKDEVNIHMPQIVSLLEQTKDVFTNSYREMCIVISNGDSSLGIVVDEVVSVEPIFPVGSSNVIGNLYKGDLVSSIAQSKNSSGQILVLNDEKLFSVM